MKFILAILVASTSAISLRTACKESSSDEVRCIPDSMLFASGATGTEDLGEVIVVKRDMPIVDNFNYVDYWEKWWGSIEPNSNPL